MKIRNRKMKSSTLALAVQSSLVAMLGLSSIALAATDADEGELALMHPTNSAQIGVERVSIDSVKFGEYNGLNTSGFKFIGGFDLRGGSAYGGGEGTFRWAAQASDLGTTARSLGASAGSQGHWNVGLGYDQLNHNITDTYQTSLIGAVGDNTFTLPTDFGTINGGANPSARTMTSTQLGAFHTEAVGTSRKNTSFGAGYIFNSQFNLQMDYNHLAESGAKLLGASSQGGVSLVGGSTGRAEAVSIIMNPTSYKTDTVGVTLNWIGDNGHLTGGYSGSIFKDDYNSVSWQNAMASGASSCVGAACFVTNSMSTAPSNSFHQLNLSGGYTFWSTTKLTGGLSYGRNTQDDAYAATQTGQMQTGGLPQTSLNGLVVTTHGDLKLTNQSVTDLTLTAAMKYNDRDNRSTSNTYLYYNLGGFGTNNAYSAVNTPFSNTKTQYELAAGYRLSKAQNLRLAYDRENITRKCNNIASGAQCVVSPESVEDKIGLNYRLNVLGDVRFSTGYSYSKKKATFDNTFLTPIGSTNADPSKGINAKNFFGFVAFPYAERTQKVAKAGVNWQITQSLDLGIDGRYSKDLYGAALGVQDGRSTALNLDVTYSYTETSSVSVYASWQNSERNLADGATPASSLSAGAVGSVTVAPNKIFTNLLKDDSNTIGLSTRHRGMLGGKLEFLGDLSYSLDKSRYTTALGYTTTPACDASSQLTCGDTPDILNRVIVVKLSTGYQVTKNNKVGLGYIIQQTKSDDYVYNGEQYGYTPNRVIPTNQSAPNDTAHVVVATYTYAFM